jgi:hypothetical protein
MDRFAAARLKIERANKHIADLEAIVSRLPEAYIASVEPNEAGGETIKYSAPDVGEISGVMALIIGDAIHNLRVAIEYAYLGAVEIHAPSVLDKHTKFPVGKTRNDVESALKNRKIDVLSPKLFDRIVSEIQPYEDRNCLVVFLHDLDVRDKHWLLTPLLQLSWVHDIVVQNENGDIVTGESYPIPGHGTFRFDFGPGCKVKDKGKITLDVVFNDFFLLKGMPIVADLKDFAKIANHIINRLSTII